MPAEPTFAKTRVASVPSGPTNEARPRSTSRATPSVATRTASSNRVGMSCVRPKSCPVPFGRTAISAPVPTMPFTTSLSVPSPPTTTMSFPSAAASRARSVRWPGRSERRSSPSSPSSFARARSFGQRFAVAPFALAGLTRKMAFSLTRKG